MNPSVSTSSPRTWLAVLALCLLLLLPNLTWWWFGHGVMLWVQALLLPTALLAFLFALLGDVPWLACLLLLPFALLAPMETFYIAQYHHPTSAEIIATLVATNPRETREYLGHALVPLTLCLAAGMSLALWAAWTCRKSRLRWRHDSRIWVLAIVILAPIASFLVAFAGQPGSLPTRWFSGKALLLDLRSEIVSGYPFGIFPRFMQYHEEWDRMRANAATLEAFRFHARLTTPLHRRQIYVLVIGEASRRDHWQLFGYDRPDNPELTKTPNLVPIPDMLSAWPESITAIPMIVTRKPATAPWRQPWKEASILRAMQEAGFDTWWISNQLAIGQFDSPVSMYAYEARHVVWLNHASWTAPGSYDEDLLQPLRDVLHGSGGDLFIVLHMMGSHESYDYRYPPAFARFRPTVVGSGQVAERDARARNSYDNSILYTDHVLAQIIATLRASGAVSALWYESDHGETLPTPTCAKEGHGLGTKPEYEIAALFWYSGAYATAFPQRVAAFKANADRRTMSADTFESLIDMASTDFPGHDESRSLFSPQWRYRPRIVDQNWSVDFDHAVFGKGCQVVLPPNG